MLKQLLNTLSVIRKKEHGNTVKGYWKHFLWQVRRVLRLFPFEQRISSSVIIAPNGGCGVSALINCLNMYDFNNMNLFKMLLGNYGGNFLDVGANIGAYSLVAAESKRAVIYAFEPHPEAYHLLTRNICLNHCDNVTPVNRAVSDSAGLVPFSDNPELSLNHLISSSFYGQNVIRVQSVSLDLFCREERIIPNYVKVDVEGYEYLVIRGLKENLTKVNLISLEINELSARIGKTQDDILSLMHEGKLLGPFYYFHKGGLFARSRGPVQEDPIFISRAFRDRLLEDGFSFEHGRTMASSFNSHGLSGNIFPGAD